MMNNPDCFVYQVVYLPNSIPVRGASAQAARQSELQMKVGLIIAPLLSPRANWLAGRNERRGEALHKAAAPHYSPRAA